jgi:hypothetical protein
MIARDTAVVHRDPAWAPFHHFSAATTNVTLDVGAVGLDVLHVFPFPAEGYSCQ